MDCTPTIDSQSVQHRRSAGEIRCSIMLWYTAIIQGLIPDDWAAPAHRFWHSIAKRIWPRNECPVKANREGRDEGKLLQDVLPLAEVLAIIYKSKGEHDIRVEKDHTRFRSLINLIGKMKEVLKGRKEEVEDGPGEYVLPEADEDDKVSIVSSDTSDVGSEYYTVRSIASWKERTSWFFCFARGKKRGVV